MKLIISTIKNELKSFLLKLLHVGRSNTDSPQKTNTKDGNMDLILQHPCFVELSMWKSTKLSHLDIEDPAKKEMTKDYIKIIQSVCEERMDTLRSTAFTDAIPLFTTDTISDVVTSVASEVHKLAAINDIPFIFLDRAEGIIFRHMSAMEEVIMDIQLFGRWNCETDKILATLDIVYAYIRMMGAELPLLVNSMNGELKMALAGSKYDPN